MAEDFYVVLTNDSSYFCEGLDQLKVKFVKTIDELKKFRSNEHILISCSTGIIVPREVYSEFKAAFNIHPSSPEFPGRDPHHFATYFGVNSYGATLHVMEERVDAGDILLTHLVDVCEKKILPSMLLEIANESARLLLHKIIEGQVDVMSLESSGVQWGNTKYTRADFLRYCNVTDCTEGELKKRIRAFNLKGHRNLYIVFHNKEFYLEI